MNTAYVDPTKETSRQIKAYTFEMDDERKWVTVITAEGRYSRRVCDLLEVVKDPEVVGVPRKMYHEMLEFAQNNNGVEEQ